MLLYICNYDAKKKVHPCSRDPDLPVELDWLGVMSDGLLLSKEFSFLILGSYFYSTTTTTTTTTCTHGCDISQTSGRLYIYERDLWRLNNLPSKRRVTWRKC
jgi:hypothetical protein